MPFCCDCNEDLMKARFSKNQLKKDPSSRRCKACVEMMTKSQAEAQAQASTKVKQQAQTFKTPTEEKVIEDAQVSPSTPAVDNVEDEKVSQVAPVRLEESPEEATLAIEETGKNAEECSTALETNDSIKEEEDVSPGGEVVKESNGKDDASADVEHADEGKIESKNVDGENDAAEIELNSYSRDCDNRNIADKTFTETVPSIHVDEKQIVSVSQDTIEEKDGASVISECNKTMDEKGKDATLEEEAQVVSEPQDIIEEEEAVCIEDEAQAISVSRETIEEKKEAATLVEDEAQLVSICEETLEEKRKVVTLMIEESQVMVASQETVEEKKEAEATADVKQMAENEAQATATSQETIEEKKGTVNVVHDKQTENENSKLKGDEAHADVENMDVEEISCIHRQTSRPINVGICAMDKKARSKPMEQILSRLDKELFQIVFFGDDMILNQPVEAWPVCDVLIAFYSNGYPLEKAEKYAEMHKPYLLNDLKMQRTLKDRRRVYDLLERSGIDVPRHVFMNRDGYVSHTNRHCENDVDNDGEEEELIEHDDHIEVNGVTIQKPFVEKPVDADDHNIAIYYPSSAGGGCKKLFRKVGDRSSEFYPDINEIRREGSYIYEEFVETQGTDVKMYTVGPDYGHAEARKSPTVDGRVERNAEGKEVRFPVILTLREKEIARRIVVVFKQLVCGFDLLRVQEGDSLVSYVCDVNGWSFVKNSKKYYDDCAQLLTEHMLAAVNPKALSGFSALDPLMTTIKNFSVQTPRRRRHRSVSGRSSIASSRTLDSCPHSPVKEIDIITDESGLLSSQNAAATLEEGATHVRKLPDGLVNNPSTRSAASSLNGDDDTQATSTNMEKVPAGTHQEELRCVITVVRHGDRTPKQKLKVNMSEPLLLNYFHKYCKNCRKDLKIKAKKPMTEFLATVLAMIAEKESTTSSTNKIAAEKEVLYKLLHMRDVLERWKIGGLNRKLQLKPRKWDEFTDGNGKRVLRCAEVQLILKWGGNLTKLGEKQAIRLGQKLRHEMYPNTPGGGILRLHSTFRHDMKIKTSDEGRVMKTAAAFAKGLLELEGSIPPILVSLVHKEKDSLHMLDPSGNKEVKEELEACKLEVNKNLQKDFNVADASDEMIEAAVGPKTLTSMTKALSEVNNPRKTLFEIRNTIGRLLGQLDDMLGLMSSDFENKNEGGEGLKGGEDDDEALSGIKLYKGETLLELTERWRLLHKKLYDEENDEFDLSRVPDVHDNVRFDMLHNPHLGLTATLEKLYNLAKVMADCVVPQEYGTSVEEKRSIGNKMCRALLEKIKYDLIIARTDNQVDMRYMINLDYSTDLSQHINTMGRRIRTRLYFTSESHLHTLLNVLRFPSKVEGAKKSPLSKRGIEIVNEAPELCYLTQVVIRLFENTSKDVKDPKRFRIEIFFSPGASATPLHMSELRRDEDASRFDTEPLKLISSSYLTCQEVEDYFSESIREGETEEDDDDTASVMPNTADVKKVKDNKQVASSVGSEKTARTIGSPTDGEKNAAYEDLVRIVTIAEDKNLEIEPDQNTTIDDDSDEVMEERPTKADVDEECEEETPIEKREVDAMARILSKQFFWTSVAAVSFVFGIGFIVLSREVVQNDFKTRRYTRR